MKNELVQLVSKKPRACLCVIMVTATTATDKAVVSCQEGVEASVGGSAPVCKGVDAEAEVGVASETYNRLTLAEGEIYTFTIQVRFTSQSCY